MKQSLLIKQAIVLDSQSSWNGKKVDIFIQDGCIASIGSSLEVVAEQRFDAHNSYISVGWLDAYGFCPDPGEEFKESLESYAKTAKQGGFTEAVALCGTVPLAETAASIRSIINRQKEHPPKETLQCKIHPLGLASEGGKGLELSDMAELKEAGALGLTDGITGGMGTAYLSKALEYAKMVGAPILIHPFDRKMVKGGEINEGVVSVNLGLKGIPVAAETTAVFSVIEISEWLNSPVVLLGISTARSVQIIREAKNRGVQVRALVPVLNLQFTDDALIEFDETFKVLPPLRTESDRLALVQGLMDGSIDGVFSNHSPEDIENKNLEFAYAHFGAATLPAFAHLALNGLNDEQLPKMIDILTRKNREVLGLNCSKIEIGEPANLTIFEKENSDLKSESLAFNVVLKNQQLNVQVRATIIEGGLSLN